MALSIFSRDRDSEQPWSSLLSGMFGSLQPVKRALQPTDVSDHALSNSSVAASPLLRQKKALKRTADTASSEQPIKRRKIADSNSYSNTTLSARNAKISTPSAARRQRKSSETAHATHPTKTIDRYFSAAPGTTSVQLKVVEKPAVSLYDTIQQRVHDAEARSQDKRTLRSQDEGSRLKSELSTYFPNFEQIMTDAPQQPG